MRRTLARLPLLLSPLFAIACPQGGSSGRPVLAGVALSGRLVEPVVGGLPYATPTQSGVTAADGTFRYLAGEEVTFRIGGTTIGHPVRGAATLRVLELVPGASLPVTATELHHFRREGSFSQPLPGLDESFEAVNVLVLLDALDADKEGGNDVALAPGLDAVLAGTTLDLRQPSFRFQRGFALRAAAYRAFDAGLLLDARVRDPWPVLDRQFERMGIVPQAWITTHSDSDWNNDGKLDHASDTLLDARGFPQLSRNDWNGDGTVDASETWEIDDAGRITATAYDGDGDGGPDSTTRRTFDLHGRIEQFEQDQDGDFVVEHWTFYSYDEVGNLVLVERDDDADGAIDTVERRVYDSGGRQVRYELDDDADGLPNRIELTVWDGSGFRIETREDGNADGVPEARHYFENDERGNPVRESHDFDADGDLDSVRLLEWDGDGNLTRESYDSEADGNVNWWVARDYDAGRRVLRYTQDNGNDGTIDDAASFEYTLDVEGRVIQQRDDYGDDGTVNYIAYQSWGAEGQRLASWWDINGDGITDSVANEVQTRTTLQALAIGD